MKKILKIAIAIGVTAILAFSAVLVFSEDTLIREGATCDIPRGYNTAPSGPTNILGMSDFCKFPLKNLFDSFPEANVCVTEYPVCQPDDAPVISPGGGSQYPCLKVAPDEPR